MDDLIIDLGRHMKAVASVVAAFGDDDIRQLQEHGQIAIELGTGALPGAAAATVAAAFIAFAFGDDVGWWMLMAGTLTVLVALALTGLWLVARGLPQPGAQPPAA